MEMKGSWTRTSPVATRSVVASNARYFPRLSCSVVGFCRENSSTDAGNLRQLALSDEQAYDPFGLQAHDPLTRPESRPRAVECNDPVARRRASLHDNGGDVRQAITREIDIDER